MKRSNINRGKIAPSIHRKHYQKVMILAIILCMIINIMTPVKSSKADANSQVSVQINYLEEIAVVTAGTGGSTKFYMSTDKGKTWDSIDSVVDISSLLSTKEVIISFKGNKDLYPVSIPLQAENSSFKITYRIIGGEGRLEFSSASLSVEYRKGANGAWKTATNLMPTAMYEIKGATLYFRTPASYLNRAGKIVTVKISKRPSAPSVKLDASKLCISGLKVGQTQYRVGDRTGWTTFSALDQKSSTLDLRALLAVTPSAITIPAGIVEFRTAGADNKLNSAVKIIEISAQPTVPDAFTLNGTTLSVTDLNTKRYYEYTVVPKNSTLNLVTAKWTSFTSRNSVIVRNVAVGDKILVRLKSTTDPTTKQPILASTYKELIVTGITVK